MLSTVWSPLHGFGRAIARWNRLVIKKIRARAFFVRARRAPAVRENVFQLLYKVPENDRFESWTYKMTLVLLLKSI